MWKNRMLQVDYEGRGIVVILFERVLQFQTYIENYLTAGSRNFIFEIELPGGQVVLWARWNSDLDCQTVLLLFRLLFRATRPQPFGTAFVFTAWPDGLIQRRFFDSLIYCARPPAPVMVATIGSQK